MRRLLRKQVKSHLFYLYVFNVLAFSLTCVSRCSGLRSSCFCLSAGFGLFHWLLLVVCGWANASDAVEILCVSFLLPTARCDLLLTSADMGLLTSSIFLGYYLCCLFFLFDFLTKYLIVLHFKNRKLGIVIHSCWENGKREDFAILKLHVKQGPSNISFSFLANAKMQLNIVPCLVALSCVWKLQSHAFYKKYITDPVIKTADTTMWFDSHAAQWDIQCQTAVSFDRDDGGRICLGLSGWSQRKAERSGRLSGSEWHIWGGGQFGPEFLALFAPAVLQWSRVTSCQKSFYIHRDILKV